MATNVIEEIFRPQAKKFTAGTVHWLEDCVKKGTTFSEMTTLTPGLAGELLRRNKNNRSLHPMKLAQYASDMREGRWTFNGEPIIIGSDGSLIDGQHRCNAVIEANVTIPTVVVFGIPREARVTIDQGAARTAGDYLEMDGVAHGRVAAAIARGVIAYQQADGKSLGRIGEVTNSEIQAAVRNDPGFLGSAEFADHHYRYFRRLVAPTVVGFTHYVFSEINAPDADAFLKQVCVGESIKKNDPAFAVREGLMRDKITRTEKTHIIFRGWNAYRQKRKLDLAKVVGNLPALV